MDGQSEEDVVVLTASSRMIVAVVNARRLRLVAVVGHAPRSGQSEADVASRDASGASATERAASWRQGGLPLPQYSGLFFNVLPLTLEVVPGLYNCNGLDFLSRFHIKIRGARDSHMLGCETQILPAD